MADTMPLDAGALRQRVQVQQRTQTRDQQGGFSDVWQTVARRWCSIEPLRGDEFFQAAQQDARVTHRVRLRPYPGLDPTHRLLYGVRVLHITTVLTPGERGMLQELLVTEDV